MTDVSRDATGSSPPRRRPWWLHLLVVVLVVVLALAAVVVLVGHLTYGVTSCADYASEGVIPAPESWRGELVCGDFTPLLWIVLVGGTGLALVVAVRSWVRRRIAAFVVALVLLPGLPLLAAAAVSVVPADCTDGQRAEHGAEGCERDREQD